MVYTFAADLSKHDGVWHCDAVVNGVVKIKKTRLFVYCPGVYNTSASTTNPSIGDSIELNCKVLGPSGERVQWFMTAPGSIDRGIAAVTERDQCEYYSEAIRFAPSTVCHPSTSNHFFNLSIKEIRKSHEGYWRCIDYGNMCFSEPVRITIAN